MKLVGFPYAGGSGSSYRGWADRIPDVSYVGIDRPRGWREADSGRGLAELCAELVEPRLDVFSPPFALYGHSAGAVVAFAVAHELERRHDRSPAVLIVSGARPPGAPLGRRPIAALDDEQLLAWMERAGALPPPVRDNPAVARNVLRLVRADIALAESYRADDTTPLRCPLIVVAGRDDQLAPPESMGEWSALSTGPTEVVAVPGGHFFFDQEPDRFARLVGARLRAGSPDPWAQALRG